MTLNENIEIFVVDVSFLCLRSKITIYLARKAHIASLLVEKVTILSKYLNFANVFLKKLANVFSEKTRANAHAIKLKGGKQPPYRPISSLGLVELKTLKTYIETNLANGFIRTSKSPAVALIFFACKLNNSF